MIEPVFNTLSRSILPVPSKWTVMILNGLTNKENRVRWGWKVCSLTQRMISVTMSGLSFPLWSAVRNLLLWWGENFGIWLHRAPTYLIEAGTAKATQWNTVLPPWVWTQCGIISMGLCLRGAQPSVFCPPALPVQGLVQAELHRSGLHLLAWKYIRSGLFCKQIYSFTARLPVTALIRDTVSQSVEVRLRLH